MGEEELTENVNLILHVENGVNVKEIMMLMI